MATSTKKKKAPVVTKKKVKDIPVAPPALIEAVAKEVPKAAPKAVPAHELGADAKPFEDAWTKARAKTIAAIDTWHNTVRTQAAALGQRAAHAKAAAEAKTVAEAKTAAEAKAAALARDDDEEDDEAETEALLQACLADMGVGVPPTHHVPVATLPPTVPARKRIRDDDDGDEGPEPRITKSVGGGHNTTSILDLVETLANPGELGVKRVWEVMGATYGRPERIVVPAEIVAVLSGLATGLRLSQVACINEALHRLDEGRRTALLEAVGAVTQEVDGRAILLRRPYLFEAVEVLAHAFLLEELRYHSSPSQTGSFRNQERVQRMEVLRKHWAPAKEGRTVDPAGDAGSGSGAGRPRPRFGAALGRTGDNGEGRKCFTCGKSGHVARACREPRCHRCGKSGHVEKDCRKK
jgi:hypothetical protein